MSPKARKRASQKRSALAISERLGFEKPRILNQAPVISFVNPLMLVQSRPAT
jgi:hypothetical protein